MFILNKYHKIYFSIIDRAKSRTLPPETYAEKHHVIPKSLGGTNDESNIVRLTAREHIICHLLLIKMTNGNDKCKMSAASWRMMFGGKNHNRNKISSKLFEMSRSEMAKAASIRSSQYRHSDEAKRKISESKIGKPRMISPEWREKIASSLRGRVLGPYSEERNRKNSESHIGIKKGPPSEEHKRKISESKKGKKIKIDPVTGKRFYTRSPT